MAQNQSEKSPPSDSHDPREVRRADGSLNDYKSLQDNRKDGNLRTNGWEETCLISSRSVPVEVLDIQPRRRPGLLLNSLLTTNKNTVTRGVPVVPRENPRPLRTVEYCVGSRERSSLLCRSVLPHEPDSDMPIKTAHEPRPVGPERSGTYDLDVGLSPHDQTSNKLSGQSDFTVSSKSTTDPLSETILPFFSIVDRKSGNCQISPATVDSVARQTYDHPPKFSASDSTRQRPQSMVFASPHIPFQTPSAHTANLSRKRKASNGHEFDPMHRGAFGTGSTNKPILRTNSYSKGEATTRNLDDPSVHNRDGAHHKQGSSSILGSMCRMPDRRRYDEDEPKPSHVHCYADKYDRAQDDHPTRGVIEQQPHRTPLQGLCQLSVALRQPVAEIPYPVPIGAMTSDYRENLRQLETIRLSDKEYSRIEAHLYSNHNLTTTKNVNPTSLVPIALTTIQRREVGIRPLPSKIFIKSFSELPHGQDHWLWEFPTYDPRDDERRHAPLPLLFTDFGPNPRIVLMCLILDMMLVHGNSGWWIVHFDYKWRGYVGRVWEEVEPVIERWDFWKSIPLFLTTSEQFTRMHDKLERRQPIPLTTKQLATISALAAMEL